MKNTPLSKNSKFYLEEQVKKNNEEEYLKKLLGIMKNGSGSLEDRAVLNHSLSKVVEMTTSLEERTKRPPLKATLFSGKERLGRWAVVITGVPKGEGIIIGKIYYEEDNWKNWIEITLSDIQKDGAKFKATLV